MFKVKKLMCSNCNQPIETNETFTVELKLPSPLKMPVGPLDVALHKQAEKITCSKCKN